MVLVKKSDTNYIIILSISSAKCNFFCKRFIRGFCLYYNKNRLYGAN